MLGSAYWILRVITGVTSVVVVIVVVVYKRGSLAGTSPYPYISIYIHTFARVFPLDFIYIVNEEVEGSRRRERTGIIRFVLFTYVYFSWMSSVVRRASNDDGGGA